MIRLTVRCDTGHVFEGWFRSNTSFDEDVAAGRLSCPLCGSIEVERGIMAPAIVSRKAEASGASKPGHRSPHGEDGSRSPDGAADQPAHRDAGPSGPTMADPRAQKAMMAKAIGFYQAVAAVRAHVEKHFENVGDSFAEEARKIHYAEADARPIHGTASREDVRQLDDEGIEVAILPALPRHDG